MDDPLPFDEGGRKPRTRNKRRSSILKPPSGAPLQDLDLNVKAPENAAAKVKSRRVSFSRSNQIKEFQSGSQTLTIWNSTYEEDQSQNQSAQQQQKQQQRAGPQQRGGVLRPAGLPVQQRGRIIAGQTSSVSPSKKAPLQITIPPKTDSPKKFLPTQPVVDTTNFLKSLGEPEPEVNSGAFLQSLGGASGGDDGVNESVDQENSFLEMLNQLEGPPKTAVNTKENRGKSRGEVLASQSRTVVGQVDMSRTLVGDDLDLSEDEDDSMVDTGGFLAALAAPSTNATVFDGGMDVTGALSMTCMDSGAEVTCHDGGMNMTCRDGGMEMTCRDGGMEMTCRDGGMEMTCRDGGMEMTCRDGGMGLDTTCRGENSLLDITCPDKNESVNFDAYKNMDITSDNVFEEDKNKIQLPVEDYYQTLAKKLEPELPGSEGSSRNSSFDGGATATMPFSGLALANNTLLLPRKESEEDDEDMTKVPIQIINYDPLRPVEGLIGHRQLPDSRAVPRSIVANQTNVDPSNMEVTRAGHLEKNDFPADMELTKVDRTRIGSTDMDMTGAVQDNVPSSVDMEMTRAGHQNATLAQRSDMEMTRAGHQSATLVQRSDMELTRAVHQSATLVQRSDMEMTRVGHQNATLAQRSDMEMTRVGHQSATLVQRSDMEMTRAGHQSATLVQRSDMEMTRGGHQNVFSDRTQLGTMQMELTRADQKGADMNLTKPMLQNGTRIASTDMELTNLANLKGNNPNQSQRMAPKIISSKTDLTRSSQQSRTRMSTADMELTKITPQNGTKMCSVDMELTKNDALTGGTQVSAVPVAMPQFNVSDVEFTEAVPIDLEPKEVGDITSFVPKDEYESTRRLDFLIPKQVEAKCPVETVPNLPSVDTELTDVLPRQVFPQDIGDITSFVPKGECESTRRVDIFIPKPVQETEDDDLDMDNSMMAEFQQRVQESKEEELINSTRPASADLQLTTDLTVTNKFEDLMPKEKSNEPMDLGAESIQASSSKSSTPGRDVTGAFKADYDPPCLITPDHESNEVAKISTSTAATREARSSGGDLLRARFPSPTPDDISPERTEMIGPMPRFNKSVFQGDVTTFAPRDTYESTRRVGDLLPKVVMDVTTFAPKNDYESTRRIQDLVPQPIGDITSFMPKGQYESTRRIDAIIPMAYREVKRSDEEDNDVIDMVEEVQRQGNGQAEQVTMNSSDSRKIYLSRPLEGIKPLAMEKKEVSQPVDVAQTPVEIETNEVVPAVELTHPMEITQPIEVTQAMELTQPVEVTQPHESTQQFQTAESLEAMRQVEITQPDDIEVSLVAARKIDNIETGMDEMENYSSPKRYLNDKEDLDNSPKRKKLNNPVDNPDKTTESINLKKNESSPDSQEEIRRIIASCKVSYANESVNTVEQSQNYKSLNKTASIKERLRGLSHSFIDGQERNEKINSTEARNDENIENIDASSAMELTRINKTNAALQMTRIDITRVPTPEVDITKMASPVSSSHTPLGLSNSLISPLRSEEVLGSSLHSEVVIGSSVHSEEVLGSPLRSEDALGSSLHSEEVLGSQLHSEEVLGSPLRSEEALGSQHRSEEVLGCPLHSEEALGSQLPSEEVFSKVSYIGEAVQAKEPARMQSPDVNLSEASNVQKSQIVHSELCLSSSIISPLRGQSEGSSLSAALMTSNFSNTSSSVSAARVVSQVPSFSNSDSIGAVPSFPSQTATSLKDDSISVNSLKEDMSNSVSVATQKANNSSSSFATSQKLNGSNLISVPSLKENISHSISVISQKDESPIPMSEPSFSSQTMADSMSINSLKENISNSIYVPSQKENISIPVSVPSMKDDSLSITSRKEDISNPVTTASVSSEKGDLSFSEPEASISTDCVPAEMMATSANIAPLSSQLSDVASSTGVASLPSQLTISSHGESSPRLSSMDSISSLNTGPSSQPAKPAADLDDLEVSFRALNAEAQNISSQFKNLSQGLVDVDSLPKTDSLQFKEESDENALHYIASSNPSNLISEEIYSNPKAVVETSVSRKRQTTEPISEEAAKSPKTEIVAMEYPVQNEHPQVTIQPPSPRQSRSDTNVIPQKVLKREKSPPRLPEVTIFDDLKAKKVPKMLVDDDEDDNDWRFEMHDEESKTAIFSWMNRSMFLVLHLGPRLEAKKTRKSIGKLVIHFPITKIYLDTVRNINGHDFPGKIVPDPNRDLAQFTIIRKFTSVALHSMCPNTCSLSAVLKNISQYVTPANQFMDALDYVDDNHFPFKISNNVVTVGFVSTLLEQAFDLTIDFSGGFSSAPERLTVKAVIGEPNVSLIEKVAKMAQPGPSFIQEIAAKIGQYLEEKERTASRKQ